MGEDALSPEAEALLNAVLSEPENFDHRQVLMDRLLEEAHPRGELLQMQFSPSRDERAESRFIKKHRDELLGALAPVVHAESFAHGFLYSAGLKRGEVAKHPEVIGHPLWATVFALKGPGDELISSHPVMRSLRALGSTSLPVNALGALRELRALHAFELTSERASALSSSSFLPKLRVLHVRAHGDEAELLFPRLAGLETFGLSLLDAGVEESWPTILRLLEFAGPSTSISFESGLNVEFTRDEGIVSLTRVDFLNDVQPMRAPGEAELLLALAEAAGLTPKGE